MVFVQCTHLTVSLENKNYFKDTRRYSEQIFICLCISYISYPGKGIIFPFQLAFHSPPAVIQSNKLSRVTVSLFVFFLYLIWQIVTILLSQSSTFVRRAGLSKQAEPCNRVRSSAEEQQPVRHDSRTLRSEYKQGSPSSMELRVGGLGICYISF